MDFYVGLHLFLFLQIMEMHNPSKVAGFVEYKAPVYLLYTKERFPPHGIPRYYMAQVRSPESLSHITVPPFVTYFIPRKDSLLMRLPQVCLICTATT